MSFLVTARKYRPATFSEVVAQEHVVGTLLNSIRLQRIAHAYLFSGPRGVGKTTTARIFAKAINCPNAVDGEPCNTCVTCTEITEGRCIDIIEIDGASNNGVEQVRSIRDAARYLPTREKYKMYIIDEVHMLTGAAFNALLKTLEEPPPHVLFVFATTEPHKLPPTVISRCQRYDFKRIAIEDIVSQLRAICEKEGLAAEDAALFAIAKKGDGSMRDSESIFDQVVAFSGADLTYTSVREVLHVVDTDTFFRLTDLITAQDTRGGFELANEVLMSGYDIQDFLGGLEEHFRNILVVRSTGSTALIEAPDEIRARYEAASAHFSEGDVLRLLRLTSEVMQAVRYSAQPRLKFEVALISMIRIDSTVSITELLSSGGLGRSAESSTSQGTAPASSPMRASSHAVSQPSRAVQPAVQHSTPQPPAASTGPASIHGSVAIEGAPASAVPSAGSSAMTAAHAGSIQDLSSTDAPRTLDASGLQPAAVVPHAAATPAQSPRHPLMQAAPESAAPGTADHHPYAPITDLGLQDLPPLPELPGMPPPEELLSLPDLASYAGMVREPGGARKAQRGPMEGSPAHVHASTMTQGSVRGAATISAPAAHSEPRHTQTPRLPTRDEDASVSDTTRSRSASQAHAGWHDPSISHVPVTPPHPIVQLLIDGLGAVILSDQ